MLPTTKRAKSLTQLRHCALQFVGAQLSGIVLPSRVGEVGFGYVAPPAQIIELLMPFGQHRQLADIGRAPILGVEGAE